MNVAMFPENIYKNGWRAQFHPHAVISVNSCIDKTGCDYVRLVIPFSIPENFCNSIKISTIPTINVEIKKKKPLRSQCLILTSRPSRKSASTRDDGEEHHSQESKEGTENPRLCWKLERQQHVCGNLWNQTVRWGLPGTHLTVELNKAQRLLPEPPQAPSFP